MKKTAKKIVVATLLASLLMTQLSACTQDDTGDTEGTGDTDVSQTEFSIFAGVSALSPSNEEKEIVTLMNEAMDVSIVWDCATGDALTERKNLLLGTNDLPDAFMAAGITDYELTTYGENGSFIALNDYINENTMPNLTAVLEQRPDALAAVTMPDGNIYSLPQITEMGFTHTDGEIYGIGSVPQFTVINTDWLAQLDMEMPQTIDDLYNVLKAFKENDMNGNGDTTDEIPLSFIFPEDNGAWCAGMGTFFAPFGFTDYNMNHTAVEDGEVVYQAMREEYKEAIAYYSTWYQEGLIDIEVFTQDATAYIAKGANEEVILGSYVWWEIPEVVGADRADSYGYIPFLEGADGTLDVNVNAQGTVGRGRFVVTSECDNPELLLQWIDQMYEPTISMQAMYGPIGVFFEETPDENGVYVNAAPPEGMTEGEMKSTYELQGVLAQLNEHYGSLYYMEDRAQERLVDLETVWFPDITDLSYFPTNVVYSLEEVDVINDNLEDIKDYTDEMAAKWLTQGGIEEDWDTYVAQLESMGIYEVISAQQAAYDRYMDAAE